MSITISKENLNILGNRLGYLPRRITHEDHVVIDSHFKHILDELDMTYVEELN